MNVYERILTEFKEAVDKKYENNDSIFTVFDPQSLNKVVNKTETSELTFGVAKKYNWDRHNSVTFSISIEDFNVREFISNYTIFALMENSDVFKVIFTNKLDYNPIPNQVGVISIDSENGEELTLSAGLGAESNLILNELNLFIRKCSTPKDTADAYKINLLSVVDGMVNFKPRYLQVENLIEENYDPKIVSQINYSIKNLNSDHPTGKIFILEGPPGTGKSYAIRHIIKQTEKNIQPIIIPVNLTHRLSGPELMETLLCFQESKKKYCFIIEDADRIINSESNEDISEILNFGDGIIGEALDTRLILTTNLKKAKINQALTRPGRLCSYIEFINIKPEQASNIHKRITGEDKVFENSMSLAEIYRSAKDLEFNEFSTSNIKSTGQYL